MAACLCGASQSGCPINPLDKKAPHLTPALIQHNSLAKSAALTLYGLPPPVPIKDLRAPLSANQVVIRAAKIRGLINKGSSLLASGSLCLNRWHRSAFWERPIDARTPGVPWNGEQRKSLALPPNARRGRLLPTFRGELSLGWSSTLLPPFFFLCLSYITDGLSNSPVGRNT